MFKRADLAKKETERSQRKEYIKEVIKVESEINDSINNGRMLTGLRWEAILPPTPMIEELKELGYNVVWNEDTKYLQINWKE